jgi:hypothetical protein
VRQRPNLTVIEFGECHLGVSVEERLLINTAHALDGPHVVGVLRAQISGMRALDLAVGFLSKCVVTQSFSYAKMTSQTSLEVLWQKGR